MIAKIQNGLFRSTFKTIIKLMPPPRPLVFEGLDSINKLCEHIHNSGIKTLLVVTSPEIVELGLLKLTLQSLSELGVKHHVYTDIPPNSPISSVKKGIEFYHSRHCESILAFGGGSVIDAAKAMVLQIGSGKPIEKLVGLFKGRRAIPFFVVPTTAGTGSEITSIAVVTRDKTHEKVFIVDHKALPLAVALTAEPMLGLPPHITADTGMDALTHAIEAYVSKINSPSSMQDAEQAIQIIFKHLEPVFQDGRNAKARSQMAKASYLAGDAFNRLGLGFAHAISHQLTAMYGVPHGRANAIVLPRVLKASMPKVSPSLAKLARLIGESRDASSEEALAHLFISRIEYLSASLQIPKGLPEILDTDIPRIARRAHKEAIWNYPVAKLLSVMECRKILKEIQNATTP